MSAISLEHLKSVLKSLSSTIFKNIEKVNSAAEQAQATADEAVKTHENKMDKVNPSGTGYIVMNPLTGREYGKNSSSFGRGSATAENAHAEGTSTASGIESHAEGNVTKATGIASHAEGTGTEATSNSAHSEGGYTKATHWYAHAEGNGTQATAIAAHAEGISTQANSKGAHAEGLHTRAYVNNPGTHAQGRANIPDADGKYAHIVGNGKITNLDNTGVTSVETYSNAHTVDWDGNAWYAGNVYVGGTGQDDENASKLISEKQVGKGLKMVGDALTVDEGEYELIDTVTLDEDVTRVTLTKEKNGTPYRFTSVMVWVHTEVGEADSTGRLFYYNGETLIGRSYVQKLVTGTTKQFTNGVCWLINGRWFSFTLGSITDGNAGLNSNQINNYPLLNGIYGIKDFDCINRIDVATSTENVTLKAGSYIEIWGVRA